MEQRTARSLEAEASVHDAGALLCALEAATPDVEALVRAVEASLRDAEALLCAVEASALDVEALVRAVEASARDVEALLCEPEALAYDLEGKLCEASQVRISFASLGVLAFWRLGGSPKILANLGVLLP